MNSEERLVSRVSKNDLQFAISREIAHLDRAETIQGFNRWAVLGAISFIIWELLNVYSKANLLIAIHGFYFLFFSTFFLRSAWKFIVSNKNSSKSGSVRYFVLSSPARRGNAFGFFLVFAILAICAFISAPKAIWGNLIPFNFLLIISIAFIIYIPIISFIPTQKEVQQNNNDYGYWVFLIFTQLVLAYSAYIYFDSLISQSAKISTHDIKFTLLVSAIFILFIREILALETREISTHLRRLELDLAIGRATTDEAVERFEMLMLGASMESAIKPWIEKIVFHADDAKSLIQESSRLLAIAKNELNGSSENKLDVVGSLLDSVIKLQSQVTKNLDNGAKAMDLFVLKFRFFIKLSEVDNGEVIIVINKIRNIWSDVKTEIQFINQEFDNFKQEYQRYKTIDSRD